MFPKFPQTWKIRSPSPSYQRTPVTLCPSHVTLLNKVSSVYDNDNGGIYEHLRDEFATLSKGKPQVDFNTVLHWEEIQALLADKLVTIDELHAFFIESTQAGSLQGLMDVDEFIEFNRKIDDLFDLEDEDEVEDEEEGEEVDEYIDHINTSDPENSPENILEGEILDIGDDLSLPPDFEVWDPDLDASSLFLPDFLAYLSSFFHAHAIDGLLTFQPFAQWHDVKDMIREGRMDPSSLRDLWLEALRYENNERGGAAQSLGESEERRRQFEEQGISLDAFYRLNFRVEEVLEDIKEALEDLSDLDVQSYYQREFHSLANLGSSTSSTSGMGSGMDSTSSAGGMSSASASGMGSARCISSSNSGSTSRVTGSTDSTSTSSASNSVEHGVTVSYEQFLQWDAVQDMLEHGDITKETLDELWQQAMGHEDEQAKGIGLPSFVWINDQVCV
ncbi:hypothetical protein EON65_17025 [archaeon]|nr:MAG: hypothetical protein EON65_17025 [archaeon]